MCALLISGINKTRLTKRLLLLYGVGGRGNHSRFESSHFFLTMSIYVLNLKKEQTLCGIYGGNTAASGWRLRPLKYSSSRRQQVAVVQNDEGPPESVCIVERLPWNFPAFPLWSGEI